ncbi:sulfatase [Halococcus saccharolyticus]|uniref:Sulfatase n=1 Tax=Halococcus saccharolyticus DSM 5350 TaxID=1227455 RepID=M0MPI5_9EURY|nr:sulfatase [Halococcus saccharolyticus]EMA47541.1 sulfatase [Halococcus saccharolyticus DSM 5350]
MKTLLLTIDAWRASHASFMPDPAGDHTPNLARLAEDGVVFTEGVSHGPATPYAFPSVFTSTLPLDHGGYEHLSEDRTLVSEALDRAGWRSVGVHANPWLGEKYGYARGYTDYRDVGEFGLPGLERGRQFLLNNFSLDHPVYRAAQYVYRYAQKPLRTVTGDAAEIEIAREALEDADDDTFVWTHLLEPHAPYTPPKRHREAVGVPEIEDSPAQLVTRAQHEPESFTERERRVVRGLYAASVRHADEKAGKLLRSVDDDTLVIVTADHGEALFEHGQVGHEPNLHDELVHVPFLVRPPAGAETSIGTVDTQVRHIDIAPTILDYAGVDAPTSYRGRSLRPAIEGDDLDDELVISEVASTPTEPGRLAPDALQVAVRTPERKLIYTNDGIEGFDRRDDPGERDPIADPTGEDWDALRAALDDRLAAIEIADSDGVERDEDVQKRLQDLGYLE